MKIHDLNEVSKDTLQKYKTAAIKDVDRDIAAKSAGTLGRDEYERKMTKRGRGTAAADRRLTPHGTKLDLSPYGDAIQKDYDRYRTDEQGVSEDDIDGLPSKPPKGAKPIKFPADYDKYIKKGAKHGFQDDPNNPLRKNAPKSWKKQQGVSEGNDDPMNYNAAITGSYYEPEILDLFGQIETGMTNKDTGANRTWMGRGKDVTTKAAGTPAVGYNYSNVMKMPGMQKSATTAKPAAKTPNFAGPSAYGKTTTTFKTPAGSMTPKSPAIATPAAPAAPAAPKVPKVTSGGPTPAERDALAKRIAAASGQPVAESLKYVNNILENVTTQADVRRVNRFIKNHFGSNLTESAKIKRDRLLSEVKKSAARRRAFNRNNLK